MTAENHFNKRKYNILKYLKKLPYQEYVVAKSKLPLLVKLVNELLNGGYMYLKRIVWKYQQIN